MRAIIGSALLVSVMASPAFAQMKASERVQEVLPADVAAIVLARIAEARSRELPAQALEYRALEMAAKGASPEDVLRRIDAQVDALARARTALESGRAGSPNAGEPGDDEVVAAGEAIARGVDGEAVSELASREPSGRSLAVPLHVLSQLMSRGLPADEAIKRVHAELDARRSDDQLRDDAADGGPPWGVPGKPPFAGGGLDALLRAGFGPPPGLPVNPGEDGSVQPPVPQPPVPPTGTPNP